MIDITDEFILEKIHITNVAKKEVAV